MSSLSANYNVAKLKLCVFVSVCGRHLHVYLSRGIVHVGVLLEYLTINQVFGKKKMTQPCLHFGMCMYRTHIHVFI